MQKLLIGRVLNTGEMVQDDTRLVEFEAEQLAERIRFGTNDYGVLTDTRGSTQALYKTPDGRLIVHFKDWSHGQGELTTYDLIEVDEGELEPGGAFEALGREVGYARPLTLDEALDHCWRISPATHPVGLRHES